MNKKHTTNISELTMNMLAVAGILREKIRQNDPSSSALELKVLGVVSKRNGISMKNLADLLHISAPSTTEITNKLVEEKKLKRHTHTNDRRIISLEITKEGKRTLEKSLNKASASIKDLLKNLSAQQKKDFGSVLEIIINSHIKK